MSSLCRKSMSVCVIGGYYSGLAIQVLNLVVPRSLPAGQHNHFYRQQDEFNNILLYRCIALAWIDSLTVITVNVHSSYLNCCHHPIVRTKPYCVTIHAVNAQCYSFMQIQSSSVDDTDVDDLVLNVFAFSVIASLTFSLDQTLRVVTRYMVSSFRGTRFLCMII